MRTESDIAITIGDLTLRGDLNVPRTAIGIVLFAHGSGSGRKSSRNRFVASILQENNIATLLFDLLTEQEELFDARTAHLRFDIPLLAHRLIRVTEWLRNSADLHLPIGYFGASTGAAAALIAAAHFGDSTSAVVSRGGRPDLADRYLEKVSAPTLLLIGSHDLPVIDLNQKAFDLLHCEKKLEIIQGASHLFEEPGTLQQVAQRASAWFAQHFATPATSKNR
ncbi:MAG TPA: alpha/beta hydrolase [Verrucomicrobiae bacterium]